MRRHREMAARRPCRSSIGFPLRDPRDGDVLLLDFVKTWESQFLGIGRNARVLTLNTLRRDHAADDLGLNLVFLRR